MLQLYFNSHQIQSPFRFGDGNLVENIKLGFKRRFKSILGVVIEDIQPGSKQALHLRIGLGNKFYHQILTDLTKELRQFGQRYVIGNG